MASIFRQFWSPQCRWAPFQLRYSVTKAFHTTRAPAISSSPFLRADDAYYTKLFDFDLSTVAAGVKPDPMWETTSKAFQPTMSRYATYRDANEEWRRRSQQRVPTLARPGTPHSGRSVMVVAGDVGSAFRRLSAILARNRVRVEMLANQRFEKPTAKRMRLRSERHRRRFAELIKQKVQLVQAIRRRGG